jgi:hypothetical protein
MQIEEDLVWIQATWCRASHVQQKNGEKFLWQRKCIEIVLQKSGIMDCKPITNSHDDRFEEVERLWSSIPVPILIIEWLADVFGEYSDGYLVWFENSFRWNLAMRIEQLQIMTWNVFMGCLSYVQLHGFIDSD